MLIIYVSTWQDAKMLILNVAVTCSLMMSNFVFFQIFYNKLVYQVTPALFILYHCVLALEALGKG